MELELENKLCQTIAPLIIIKISTSIRPLYLDQIPVILLYQCEIKYCICKANNK